MSDETIIVREQGTIFLGGPPLVKAATGEIVTAEDLGGADVHARTSGVVDHYAHDDRHALALCRRIVARLNHVKQPPVELRASQPPRYDPAELYGVVPVDLRAPYDARDVIARIVDASDFDEFKRLYGATLICGFAHIRGYPVGILANNGILFSEIRPEGRAFRRVVQPEGNTAGVPAEHHRLHGRPQIRGRRHRQGRRQDGHRRFHHRGAEVHGDHRRQLWCRQLRHVRPRLRAAIPVHVAQCPNFGDGRRAGGDGAVAGAPREIASVEQEEAFKAPIRAQYETQGHPYYATARLWDDGIIDPVDTRRVLGLALSAALNAPIPQTQFGVFRM